MEETKEAIAQGAGGARLKKSAGGKKWLLIPVIIVGCLLAAYLGLCAYAGSLDTFQPNRHINGIDVGGMTVEEAQKTLEQTLLAQPITLSDPDHDIQTVVTVAELGYTASDFEGAAQFWMDADQSQSFLRKGWAYLAYATGRWPGGASWPTVDSAALSAVVSRLAEEFAHAQHAVDSTYEVQEDSIAITKAKDGLTLQEDTLCTALADISTYSQQDYQVSLTFDSVPAQVLTAQEIYDQVAAEMKNAGYDAASGTITPEQLGAEFDVPAAQAQLDAAAPGETVSIPAQIEYPRVTAAQLKTVLFRDVLGTYQTHVSGTAARISNVKLSASTISGTVLNSGDVFSYNETVGQRTAARGYQAAPAYVQGETVDEIGGGICQTSSTLYYACLLSNLEITERYAHRYIPAYITPGMDATVSWGGPDYKFTNNTDYPIKIVTSYANNYLTVKILGTKTDGITVKMTNEQLSSTPYEVVYEDDASLPAGTETVKTTPYTGSKYKSYRNLYDANGNLISTTYEATSDYKVRNKVILRGPAVETSAASTGTTAVEAPITPVTPVTPITPTSPVTSETPADQTETTETPILVVPPSGETEDDTPAA